MADPLKPASATGGGGERDQAAELARIRAEYERRRREIPDEHWKVRLFIRQLRERVLLAELSRAGLLPLDDRRILDVGCGAGQWLADFETWGAARSNLAGLELDPRSAALARSRLAPARAGLADGEADIQEGNAGELPWEDETFHVVLQATMLSSILDHGMRREIASEMMRVLAPRGVILSYDMRVGNPRNARVRSVTKRELAELFDGMALRTKRLTLALPLSRHLAGRSWAAAVTLERLSIFNTHLLAILRRPGAA